MELIAIGVERRPVVVHLESEHDVGLPDIPARAAALIERMARRHVEARTRVDHRALQQLGELDQAIVALLRAGIAVGDQHGVLGVDQHPRGFRHRARIALRIGDRRQLGDPELLPFLDRVFLKRAVGDDHHRQSRRRHRDLVGADGRLGEVLQRCGIIVPLRVVADDDGGILRGVIPFDAGTPLLHRHDIADHAIDRHAVAPGVVERHGGVVQADGAVREDAERLLLDLVVAVAHRHRDFLVRAGEEFGIDVAAVIDQRLVQAAEARRGVRRHVLEAEALQAVDHEIAAAPPDGQRLERGRDGGLRRAVGERHGVARRRGAAWAATAVSGVASAAAPARPAPFRNLRRFTFGTSVLLRHFGLPNSFGCRLVRE